MINSIRKGAASALSLLAALLCLPHAADAQSPGRPTDPIAIHHSGSNTMVRIAGRQRYLLLPVEESMPDARVEILVDGNLVRTLYVRLADKAIDYTVPLDLTPYTSRGRVLLNIVNPRNASGQICWRQMRLSDAFDTSNREKYRPAYHHTPLYGWMNDPNGMFFKDGTWHLYFQHNPYGSKWQNMTWGHSTSTDLVHWTAQPNAIEPNGLGTVFSGSAVVDSDNTAGFGSDAVVALYTSAGASQVQSLAHSTDDGSTFDIYASNPVIATEQEARDPKAFRNPDTGRWNLILASAPAREMLIYSSDDLRSWTLESSFGAGYGSHEGVWECPDLVRLPVRGTDTFKWVLICNIGSGGPSGGSATQYFVGDFDGRRFTCDTPAEQTLWMDYGKDHYAAVTWADAPDNRCTSIAWMSNWEYANDVPTMQFRSANTLPRDLDLFRAPDGTLRLGVTPSPEVETLRGTAENYGPATIATKTVSYALPATNDGICEIELELNARSAQKVNIALCNDKGEEVAMTYDFAAGTLSMDRTRSGAADFSDRFPAVTVAPTLNDNGRYTLRLFIDRCSVEAFDGEGRFAMTNLLFPTAPYSSLRLSAEGGKARMTALRIYPLETDQR